MNYTFWTISEVKSYRYVTVSDTTYDDGLIVRSSRNLNATINLGWKVSYTNRRHISHGVRNNSELHMVTLINNTNIIERMIQNWPYVMESSFTNLQDSSLTLFVSEDIYRKLLKEAAGMKLSCSREDLEREKLNKIEEVKPVRIRINNAILDLEI